MFTRENTVCVQEPTVNDDVTKSGNFQNPLGSKKRENVLAIETQDKPSKICLKKMVSIVSMIN